ncbi:hypothetical protein OHA72_42320 [Dactylosporangium sp. NBC_01737]|uniref:hypothetical protein n=1 Tax=Dactylosporangium sp. NBC_01737 TaxID=2975959 RepID=UPI002E0EF32C|nr:hypothetical protein OHA72_42320 [Dactylosporangium sp. NBC_01737]
MFGPIGGPGGPAIGSPAAAQQLVRQQQEQYFAWRAAQDRAAAARAAEVAAARVRWRASGLRCDVVTGCGAVAAGRCSGCRHTFCESHQSYDRPADGSAVRVMTDQCVLCQAAQVAAALAAAEQAANAAAEEEQRRRREARRQRQQELREHAARVRAHERENDWPGARRLLPEVERQLAATPLVRPEPTDGQVGRANAVLILGGVTVLLAGCAMIEDNLPLLGVMLGILLFTFVPLSIWALRVRRRRSRAERWAALQLERQELLSARGCGIAGCATCATG